VTPRHILDSKTNGKYYFKHVQFHFCDRITYNLWGKTKVEKLSAVYTKNQNSKTVIKTIIDIIEEIVCRNTCFECNYNI
jgi:hypothetical protein